MLKPIINTYKMNVDDFEKLKSLIYYGCGKTAEKEYPVVKPVYDEDAGVYTTYGEGSYQNDFAHVYFGSLLNASIVDFEYIYVDCDDSNEFDIILDENQNWIEQRRTKKIDSVIVQILQLSVPALQHFLVTMLDEQYQKTIAIHELNDLYDSDGHYEGISREQFIEKNLVILPRKKIKELQELLYKPIDSHKCFTQKEFNVLKNKIKKN